MSEEITGRYLLFYFACLVVFYEFFMIVPSTWIELLTAQISAWALNTLGLSSEYGLRGVWVWLTLLRAV